MSQIIDLTNQRFGRWTVLARDTSKKGTAYWLCRCDCGTERSVCGSSLRGGVSTSCGCYRTENSRTNNGTYKDELGNRYGKLLVIAKDENASKEKHRAQWVCQCDCGNIITTSSKCLREGKTTSCGCRKMSIGEENIQNILLNNNITFQAQFGISINKKYYRYDFAILNKDNTPSRFIEFDGIQHFDNEHKHWGQDIVKTQERDAIKNNYALLHNIPLVRIPYVHRDDITLDMLLGTDYLIKVDAEAPDIEEAQEVTEDI